MGKKDTKYYLDKDALVATMAPQSDEAQSVEPSSNWNFSILL